MAGRAATNKRKRGGIARHAKRKPNKRYKKTVKYKRVGPSKNSANDDNMGVVVRKSGKVKSTKKKQIKITPAFKKGVMKALEGKRAIGFMQERSNAKFGQAIGDNIQEVGYLNKLEALNFNGLFSPIRIMDAAACLFNNKTVAFAKTSTSWFPVVNTKINVLKQWVTFDINNQSRLKKHVTFYTATQKGRKSAPTASADPIEAWDNALTLDATSLPDARNKGPNLQTINKTFLGMKPTLSKAFNKEFNIASTSVLIEPGQSYKFTVQGETGEYDMNKYHIGTDNNLTELCPWTKFVFYTVHNDLCETSTGVTGRFETAVPPANTPNSLIVEWVYNYRIEAPENTGLTTGTAGETNSQNLHLNNVRDAYIFKNYGIAQTGQINRIDDNDPTVPMNQD